MRWLLAALILSSAAVSPGHSLAQSRPTGVPQSQILTIEPARLFQETRLGQALISAMREERRLFAIQNQTLEQAFREEELELTAQRATTPREDFAELAREFDERVQAAREARDAQAADFENRSEQVERGFISQVQPILDQIMTEAGAVVLIDADTVIRRSASVDITALAIERIDAATQTLDPVESNGDENP